MSDARLRNATRAPVGVEAKTRALHERMRAGVITRERVELAAYCGSEAARPVVGDGPHEWAVASSGYSWFLSAIDCAPLAILLRGLERWGHLVMVRAAREAAKVALEAHCKRHCGAQAPPRVAGNGGHRADCVEVARAIEAVGAWLDCPCEEHRDACAAPRSYLTPSPFWHLVYLVTEWQDGASRAAKASGVCAVEGFASIAGEPTVRQAICTALVAWALGGEG